MKVNKVGFNPLDTISFICEAVPNEYYGSQGSEYLTPQHRDLKVTVVINGEPVVWNNHVELHDLIFRNLDDKPYYGPWGKNANKVIPQAGWSVFCPFTCGCGAPGCAGIWDGIYVRERGYSIEWRAKREDGYGFLPKTFFNYEKSQYKHAFKVLMWEIEELCQEFDLVVDPGYCEEQLVTGWDFLRVCKGEMKWTQSM